ncbi:DNA mismatch repair protein MutS [Oxalobacteraceae bacterium OTU3CAMAD1]|nr:DNA mismatch repair protein MutS [Oxalobacteraceae bacterium OTU3CAMAD1]
MTLIDRLTRFLLPAMPADEIGDYPYVASDVALYQRILHGDGGALDAQTWDDMLLPQYSAQLALGTSILGQQELHRRLHAPDGGEQVSASAARVRTLVDDGALRQQLLTACEGLRRADREVGETLFGAAPAPVPRWARYLPWLPMAFLLSAALALFSGFLPLWGVTLGLWLSLSLVQMRFSEAASEWERILKTLQQMLRAHTLLSKVDGMTADLRDDAARAGKVNRGMSRSLLAQLPGVREYGDWLWLMNIRHYFDSREVVRANLDLLRASFQRVAALEADLALARHLAQAPRYCWSGHGHGVTLENAVHPLLAEPAPLSFALERQGAFISGQNGIGKSTLLRTVGLNLIVARAFGFSYADAAVTPSLPVYSSMQNEDALEGGESLYIAELRRARELLALAERAPAIFIIDEIFRGTNHLESISAAAAVLHTLSASGRVIVSSHNLVLAPLLGETLAPWCVSRVDGHLRLAPGVLKETNGIALLATRGFDAAISAKANRVHDWLSDYMAHPADCEAVLGE